MYASRHIIRSWLKWLNDDLTCLKTMLIKWISLQDIQPKSMVNLRWCRWKSVDGELTKRKSFEQPQAFMKKVLTYTNGLIMSLKFFFDQKFVDRDVVQTVLTYTNELFPSPLVEKVFVAVFALHWWQFTIGGSLFMFII